MIYLSKLNIVLSFIAAAYFIIRFPYDNTIDIFSLGLEMNTIIIIVSSLLNVVISLSIYRYVGNRQEKSE